MVNGMIVFISNLNLFFPIYDAKCMMNILNAAQSKISKYTVSHKLHDGQAMPVSSTTKGQFSFLHSYVFLQLLRLLRASK